MTNNLHIDKLLHVVAISLQANMRDKIQFQLVHHYLVYSLNSTIPYSFALHRAITQLLVLVRCEAPFVTVLCPSLTCCFCATHGPIIQLSR